MFLNDSAGFSFGENPGTTVGPNGPVPIPTVTSTTATGNVILNSTSINASSGVQPRSDGIQVFNASGPAVQVNNNIVADAVGPTVNESGISLNTNVTGVSATNNIIYDVANPIVNSGTGNTTSPNAINQTGYVNPNVSIGSYNASLGGSASLAAFMAAADNQSMTTWNPAYTAAAADSYIQAGFSTSGTPPTTTSTGSATTSTGSATTSTGSTTTSTGSTTTSAGPTLTSIVETPATGDLNAGKIVTLTIKLSEAVTVAGGTPTLTLNDGGTATYSSGSGSNALTFSCTVAAGQNTSDLMATAVNLNSATIKDSAGTTANLSLTGLTQSGPQIDTTAPTISSLVESPSTGTLSPGSIVTLTVKMSEAVTVSGGTPTLTLNDGGTATYSSGSGTDALTFRYTVGAGQNTSALSATAVNLNSATVKDGGGNAANLSLSGLTQSGPQIDTSTPTGSSGTTSSGATATGSSGATSIGSSEATPTTPTISSLSPHNGKASGGYTNAHVLSLTGTAAANNKVEVFNGSAQLGTTTANGSGAWSFTTPSLNNGTQSFKAKDVNSAGKVSAASTALNVTVVTDASLTKVANNYDVTTATSDPVLKFKGANVTAGEFGAWMPIGAVQTATGYDIAWKNTGTGQYTVWTTDNNGNYTGNLIGAVSGNSHAWESIAPIFPQNLNGGGVTGPVTKVIQKDGSTSLTEVANKFYLDDTSGSDPALKYKGADVTAGEFGGWTPIGAVKTASGYDVAWKNAGTGPYTVWSTDGNGNYTGNLIGAVSGTSTALKSLERIFGQDLNGDKVVGPVTKVIQKDGSTSLTEVANQFYLDDTSGSDPALKYKGANVTAREFGGWTPIGAVKTASGYDVAWKNTTTGQYTAWATDRNGNYTRSLTGAVAGTSTALESLEPVFKQDLNHDGVIGPITKVIQKDGSTSLTEVANKFYLDDTSGSDPALKYKGANITAGEFGGWTPIGAVKTASGYDVAWKNTGTGQYTVWSTDRNGNYTGNLIGAVSGTSTALEPLERIFGQDLNGDKVIGLYAAPNAALKITSSLAGSSGSTTIGTGATLDIAAADSASVTFQGSTGTLRLDQASTFSGEIFGFKGNGTLSGSDHIDLRNIKYSSVHDSYANGVLTVTDGSGDTDKLSFNGSYTLANFKFASDGSGGTIVYDPPVPPPSSQSASAATSDDTSLSTTIGTGATLELAIGDHDAITFAGSRGPLILDASRSGTGAPNITDTVSGFGPKDIIDLPGIAFDAQTTLDYLPNGNQTGGKVTVADGIHNVSIALLGSYMASSFAMTSDNHGGTMLVTEAAHPDDQSLLSNPHHA